MPDLSALTSLQALDLEDCNPSRCCPICRRLQTSRWHLPDHLTPWKANGFKAYDSKLWEASDGWPLDSTVIDLSFYGGATLPEWLSPVHERADAQPLSLLKSLHYRYPSTARPLTSLQRLNLESCKSLTAMLDLSALTSLQTLDLERCKSLMALPDLSALTSLQALNLDGCSPSRRCPTCRRSRRFRPQGGGPVSRSTPQAVEGEWLQGV